ncbi:DUF58 domain-containing protein [Natrialbaceae archaeon A-CW1-1]
MTADPQSSASRTDRSVSGRGGEPVDDSVGEEPSTSEERPSTPNVPASEPPSADRSSNGGIDVHPTGHWKGVTAIGLLLSGIAIASAIPTIAIDPLPGLLLGAAVGLGYVVYGTVSSRPQPTLEVTRSLSTNRASVGTDVVVTTTITNTGERMLPDVRIVDGVPAELTVVDGSPRGGGPLRPGEHITLEYTVTIRRGTHEFERTEAILRDLTGTTEVVASLSSDDESTLTGTPSFVPLPGAPLRSHLRRETGRLESDSGGSGIEFYATRQYRPGDPMRRIDWNRYARTGALTTLDFREERSVTVVIVLDLRAPAYVRAEKSGLHAVDHGIDAAGRLFATLLDDGERVGIGAATPRAELWLKPGIGNDHRSRAESLLASHPALSPRPPETAFRVQYGTKQLRKRLPSDAQVLLVSPLTDDTIVTLARRLEVYGHPVSVLSPDVTAADTPGQIVGQAERTVRITHLRQYGVPVIDWDTDRSLAGAITTAARGGDSR